MALRRMVSNGLCAVANQLCPELLEKTGDLRPLMLWGYYLTAAASSSEPALLAMRHKLAEWSDGVVASGVLDATAGEHLPPIDVTEGVSVDLRPLLAKAAIVDAKDASARVWGYIGSIVQRFATAEEGRQRGGACCEKVQMFLQQPTGGGSPQFLEGAPGSDNAKAFIGSLVNHLMPAANGVASPAALQHKLVESGQFSQVFGALMTGLQTGTVDMPSLLRTAADIMANPTSLNELVDPALLRQVQQQAHSQQ